MFVQFTADSAGVARQMPYNGAPVDAAGIDGKILNSLQINQLHLQRKVSQVQFVHLCVYSDHCFEDRGSHLWTFISKCKSEWIHYANIPCVLVQE